MYNSYEPGENEFLKHSFSSPFYPLFKSRNKILVQLSNFLQNYVDMTNAEFFIEQADIKKTDNEFEKLYKLSSLTFDDTGFYITNKMRAKNEQLA
jgi:hypothetical protein